jgi:hypothetical protein
MVDLIEHNIVNKNFTDLAFDLIHTLCLIQDSVFEQIKASPFEFIWGQPQLRDLLMRLRMHGKKMLLTTNFTSK